MKNLFDTFKTGTLFVFCLFFMIVSIVELYMFSDLLSDGIPIAWFSLVFFFLFAAVAVLILLELNERSNHGFVEYTEYEEIKDEN